ncbi:hypothetical protein Leryth_000857 [Lithospermum erythrorhizon]|nr:hypothetical protein Leryth_000857 [Lithospermum erythrorhizon]
MLEEMWLYIPIRKTRLYFSTDEKLSWRLLFKKKIAQAIDSEDVIKDVDLYKIEPWDLQGIIYYSSNVSRREFHLLSSSAHSCKLLLNC